MTLLILDRDGVINEDSDDYIRTVEDWQPIPGSIDAIARLSRSGYRIAIATNQSGLGRGYFTLDVLESIHDKLCAAVEQQGGRISGIFYCPHLPTEGCTCRKPATGLLLAIERELQESARGAWFIGDSLKDLQAARAHGSKPLLVTTGKGAATQTALGQETTELDDVHSIPVCDNLEAAANFILSAQG